jgi:peptide/nickel transport system permease protein
MNSSSAAYGAIVFARSPMIPKATRMPSAVTAIRRLRKRPSACRQGPRAKAVPAGTTSTLSVVAGYILRRLILAASAVVAVSFAAFVTFGLSLDPTFPLRQSPDQRPRQFVLHAYHLSDPILARYWRWVTGLFTHGFGATVSVNTTGSPLRIAVPGEPIGPAIWHGASITAQLVGFALVLTMLGSVAVGTYSARRPYAHLDVPRLASYIVASMPTFLIAYLMRKTIVGSDVTVIRTFGGPPQFVQHGVFLVGAPTGGFVDWLRHMTLPAVALAVGLIGVYARYIRSAMLVSLGEQYTTVARAKGLSESRVVFRHVLRNSLVPFTSLLSLEMGAVVGASLAADAVFNLGGLAQVFLGGLALADPFELTALAVVTAIVVSAFLLCADLLVGALDPRLRIA